MPDVEIIDIDSALAGVTEARARLHGIEAALQDMHGPLSDIINDLHRQSDAQFATFGAVAGTPWDPLDPSTVSNKMRMGYPAPGWPLVASGELRESAIGHGPYGYGDVAEQSASFGLDMDRDGWNIAALQQWGVPWRTVHRRAYVNHSGHHVQATSYLWHLPSRPMLVATEALAQTGIARIAVHLYQPLA